MQHHHPAFVEQYAVVHSNGDGRARSRQNPHAVNDGVNDGHDVAPLQKDQQDEVTAAVSVIAEHRADIDQAKGMLMLVHGLSDPDAAFDLLRWRSQETNTKLRLLARQVIADFVEISGRDKLPLRSVYDNLFLTAHLRADPEARSGEDTG